MQNSKKSYKVILVGSGGCGKTVYLERLLTGEFRKRYIATLGVEVYPITFDTNYGKITLNIWDCAGQEKFGGSRDVYYIQADGVIFMYDNTSIASQQACRPYIIDVKRICGNIPYVLCASKCDIQKKTPVEHVPNVDTFEISSKLAYEIYAPIIDLLRNITGHEDLILVEEDEEEINSIRTRSSL